jgi:aminoglycoside phosphotransferase (APT) family kinase protein
MAVRFAEVTIAPRAAEVPSAAPVTAQTAIRYLLSAGLLTPADVVDARMEVVPMTTRNRTLAVLRDDTLHYVVKQGTVRTVSTLRHEASVYQALGKAAEAGRSEPVLAGVAHWDEPGGVLVLAALEGTDLRGAAGTSKGLPGTVMSALGRLLAATHHAPVARAAEVRPPAAPAALASYCPPVAMLSELSAATVALITALQSADGCCAELERLAGEWEHPPATAFCHNDIRWANIIRLAAAPPGRPGLCLVDWELGGHADPAWDVGSVLGWLLERWPRSVEVRARSGPQEWADLAEIPLERIQASALSFWEAYRRDAIHDGELLVRAVRYCAIRLLQTVFEGAQHAAELTAAQLLLIQLAVNILARPSEALVHLLGLRAEQA